jgi:hypothetical protein
VRYSHAEMIEKDRGDLSDMLEHGMKHVEGQEYEGRFILRSLRGISDMFRHRTCELELLGEEVRGMH